MDSVTHPGEEHTLSNTSSARVTLMDWANLELPDSWPDQLQWGAPRDMLRLLRHVRGQRVKVQLPPDLPGRDCVPTYMQLEFHHLPNGYYSKHITAGYVRWFERIMLGELGKARHQQAQALQSSRRALDLGCGGGSTGAALHSAGIPEVWGIDPSPYLLQQAARNFPFLKLVQGQAEAPPFADHFFQGIAVCFLFHEMPPRYADKAIAEIHRLLEPGGILSIAEPSPVQMMAPAFPLWRRYGWRGVYFKHLATRVYEPFVDAWHQRDIGNWLEENGFTLLQDEVGMPIRHVIARKN